MKNNSVCKWQKIIIIFLLFLLSCKKEDVPVLNTTTISNITSTSASSGGNIIDEGSSTVIARGVCWSTDITPTINDSKSVDGAGAGSFTSTIIDLFGGTTYYVRAYATNSSGTGYGMTLSFNTTGQPPSAPTVTIHNATSIQTNSAQLNGTVNANYYSTAVTFEYGLTTDYGNPIIPSQSPITGGIDENLSVNITDLTVATSYHYRIKAVNLLGTTYSSDQSFTTLGQVPTVSTMQATNTIASVAQLNGTVNANYLSTDVTFEYGITTSYGNTVTAIQSPVTGNTNTNVSASISELTIGETYHFRVVAVNSLGTTYGSDLTFTTLGQIPTVTTLAATNITTAEAQLNGIVNPNYLNTVVTFEYGITTSYDNNVLATQSPSAGNANISVNAPCVSLTEGTTYHYRVKATNTLGTTFGDDITFTTLGKPPTCITQQATNITPTTAILNGVVNAEYLSSTVTFKYGTTEIYDQTINATPSPVTGNDNTDISSSISGLTPGTSYHYRVEATNTLGTTYGDDMTFTTPITSIGEDFEGGIVFYVDATGQHGLTCAPNDHNNETQWGCLGTSITGADGTSIGTGQQNTDDIINGCAETNIAALLCHDLILNGYNDWYLPSIDELILMYVNLKSNGLGNFTPYSYYWSSSEYNSNSAWRCYFGNGGGNGGAINKNYTNAIRAVRSF